ncbi:MAG: hypothetical protein QXT77_08225 [Candidatus Methanomethylicaceae archaeon]
MQEDKVSENAHFVTLTYNTDHVPITKKGYMTLRKRDLQLFFKRLRKYHDKKFPDAKPIKYYAVGEYGSKTFRPHYHIIMFNCLDVVCIEKAWRINDKPIGDLHVGNVEAASIGYTLKYISKEKKIPMHKNDDRFPEFSLMSKGLGANYINAYTKKWHYGDFHHRMYVMTSDGKKVSMPRYYKERIYTETDRKAIARVYRENLAEKELNSQDKRNLIQSHIAQFQKQKKKSNENGKI